MSQRIMILRNRRGRQGQSIHIGAIQSTSDSVHHAAFETTSFARMSAPMLPTILDGGRLDQIPRWMCVARRGLDLRV